MIDPEHLRLFVYGTLTREAERVRLLGRSIRATPARLRGYFRGRSKYYFVARRDGTETVGVVLLDLTDRDFEILDRYENVPRLYARERIEVIDSAGQALECWIYLPTAWATDAGIS
jgi:gamma-glutamylcyclotransferase (GGCT)/AIG2-like uncharacterized protein YtfP